VRPGCRPRLERQLAWWANLPKRGGTARYGVTLDDGTSEPAFAESGQDAVDEVNLGDEAFVVASADARNRPPCRLTNVIRQVVCEQGFVDSGYICGPAGGLEIGDRVSEAKRKERLVQASRQAFGHAAARISLG
jgi:hypothetical protein